MHVGKASEQGIIFCKKKGRTNRYKEADIIRCVRKDFLFTEDNKGELKTWQKTSGQLDVTMGVPEGVEMCELIGRPIHTK